MKHGGKENACFVSFYTHKIQNKWFSWHFLYGRPTLDILAGGAVFPMGSGPLLPARRPAMAGEFASVISKT